MKAELNESWWKKADEESRNKDYIKGANDFQNKAIEALNKAIKNSEGQILTNRGIIGLERAVSILENLKAE